jgi:MFS family permease
MPANVASTGSGSISNWRVVAFLSVAFGLMYASRQFFFAIFPKLGQDLSLSNTDLGLAGSLFTWAYSGTMPFSGYLADRVSRRCLITAALGLWSLSTWGLSLSPNVLQLLSWRVLDGLAEALYVPAAISLIADTQCDSTRSRAISIHGVAQFFGIAVGGWYGGWSAQNIGWRNGLRTLAAAGLTYALVLACHLPRCNRMAGRTGPSRASFRAILSTLYFVLALAFSSFCGMLWMIYAWLPSFVYERFHLTLAQSGLRSSVYIQIGSAAGVLMGGIAGDLAARENPIYRLRVAIIGLLGSVPLALLIFRSSSVVVVEVTALAFGLSGGFFIANVFAGLYDVVATQDFALAAGILNMIGGLGAGATILLAGLYKASLGMAVLMSWCAAGSLLSGTALLVAVGRGTTHVPATPR